MKRSLMIVDDSRVVFAEMKRMLEGTGLEIVCYCRSGEEALEKYGEVQPDVVTLDIVMPGMDGLDTCQKIRECWPESRVLMVSSLAYDDTMERAEELGAKGFIFKPFTKEGLVEGLLKALEP